MKKNLFTNEQKLCYWSERLKNIEENPRPISLVVGLTGRCNWKCEFCYLGDQKPLDLNYNKLINFLDYLRNAGLKSIEITGGEPTLYKNLEKLVEVCHDTFKLKIGMTTNGSFLEQSVSYEVLKYFDWIRVSINNYYDHKEIPNFDYIPDNVYLGFNLIFHKKIQFDFSFSFLTEFLDKNPNAKYLRVALDRDCGDITSSHYDKIMNQYNNRDQRIKFRPKPIMQMYEGKCYCGYIKPILEWDGNVYNCIAELEMLGHNSPNIITDIDHPEKLLKYPKDKDMHCRFCLFKDRNEFVKKILKPTHAEFL